MTTSLLLRALALTALLSAARLHGVALDGLVKNSPFGHGPGGPMDAKPGTIEFRGMYTDKGITYYSIFNVSTKQSAWIAKGEIIEGTTPMTIKDFDPVEESLIVESGGQPVRLAMRTATVVPFKGVQAPVAATVVSGANTSGMATGGPTAPGGPLYNGGQPPSREQIEAFRDEMRRRYGDRGGRGPEGGDMRSQRGDDRGPPPSNSRSPKSSRTR
ncbi:MAG: hypothetical protein ACO3ND_04770 [Opitutales bacterium]